MKIRNLCLINKLIIILLFSINLNAADKSEKFEQDDQYIYEKDFDELTQAEHTRAKRLAEKAKIRPLVACADPGNMPMSNMKEQGYDNRVVKLLADAMGTSVQFFWRPYLERGLHRETFSNKECDLLLGMPYGYAEILTTMPIYRSTYVFASREDRQLKIKDLDDPILTNLKIGTYQHSGLREALSYHGVTANIDVHVIRQDTDLVPEHQQWQQVQKVVDGELDLAGVWGPFAGYVKTKKDGPLVLQPVNLMEDRTPLEFSLAIGMRTNDVVLKYAFDKAIQENAEEIEAVLNEFGVPLVSCSECAVQGSLPSHGSYYERFIDQAKKRYLEPLPEEQTQINADIAPADQVVDEQRLEQWLAEGADINEELNNAVVASDEFRVRYLIKRGADINYLNKLGNGLLHQAARYRDSKMLDILLSLNANPNLKDMNGKTPLIHATLSNHVPSIETLVKAGANLEIKERDQFNALSIAVGKKKFWAVLALIDAGADVNTTVGEKAMTPLMIICTQHKSKDREKNIIEGAEPVDIAKLLIEKGADVNATTSLDETPLMFAAANDNSPLIGLLVQKKADMDAKTKDGKTALDIAKEHNHEGAVKSLELFSQFSKKKKS